MFIYLRSAPEPSRDRYVINKITEQDCSYFEVIMGKLGTRPVTHAVKRCKGTLPLVTENVPLPRGLWHRRANTAPFDRLLLINSFCEIITGNRAALVCDPRGEIAKFLLKPLTKVGTLYVLTERPDIYADFGTRALRCVGSSPILINSADGITVPAALSLGEKPRAQIVLGRGGFIPCGGRVLLRGRSESRALCAAKYCFCDSADVRIALPERLRNGTLSGTVEQLKRMLDTACYPNYN